MSTEIIAALIGVLGTAVLTVLGWLIRSIIGKRKINYTLKNIYLSPYAKGLDFSEIYNEGYVITTPEKAEFFTFEFDLEISNPSSEGNAIKDVVIMLYKRKYFLNCKLGGSHPVDKKTGKSFSTLNLSERQVIECELKATFSGLYDFAVISGKIEPIILDSNKIVLEFKDIRGKKRKIIFPKYKNIFNASFLIREDS